jgi:hypothetical protein
MTVAAIRISGHQAFTIATTSAAVMPMSLQCSVH